jgi:hypothetical protein
MTPKWPPVPVPPDDPYRGPPGNDVEEPPPDPRDLPQEGPEEEPVPPAQHVWKARSDSA